jgi:hypothetical protein
MGFEGPGHDQAAAEPHGGGMPGRERHAACQRHVRNRFVQTDGIDDLALYPRGIRLTGDGFHDQSQKAVAEV